MTEKRRSKRVKVTLDLTVSSIFAQDNNRITIDSPIIVKDISRYGIGFISKSILPMNYYFNAALNIGGDDSVLYCVVKIIRCEALEDDEYSYLSGWHLFSIISLMILSDVTNSILQEIAAGAMPAAISCYLDNISFNIEFTSPGFALPFIAFIVCPTRKPIAFSLPLW